MSTTTETLQQSLSDLFAPAVQVPTMPAPRTRMEEAMVMRKSSGGHDALMRPKLAAFIASSIENRYPQRL